MSTRRSDGSAERLSKDEKGAGAGTVQGYPRFHYLRHTFATTALEHGMDVKMLFVCVSSEKRKTKPLNDYVTINTTLKQFSLEYDCGIELDNWLLFAIIYTVFRHHNGR